MEDNENLNYIGEGRRLRGGRSIHMCDVLGEADDLLKGELGGYRWFGLETTGFARGWEVEEGDVEGSQDWRETSKQF